MRNHPQWSEWRRRQSAPAVVTLAALAGALFVAGAAGCNTTRPCRPGTLFVTVRIGPFSDADSLTVDVTVAGSPSRRTTLPLSRAASGGVEVTFPSGYPTGKSVDLVVELDKASQPLATRMGSVVLVSGCGTLQIDFGGSDAAADSATGTGGEGGMGNANSGGSGGGSGGSGGLAGASGATGGSGGLAGATGGRGGGTAGTGGRGGAIGTGGRGGTGTGGVVGGTGGRGGPCVPIASTENCYNNVDDDCNGLLDCADPACDTPAQCVMFDPSLGSLGASIATTATCPAQASTARTLMSSIVAAGCSGCRCGSEAGISCSADIYGYDTLAACNDPTQPGTLVHTLTPVEGCFTPDWGAVAPTGTGTPLPGFIGGVRAPLFQGTPTGACAPSGVAAPGTPAWSTMTKFCTLPAAGGGCGAGAACVPRPVVAVGICLLQDGTHPCPNGTRISTWFTGFTDSRTCGACTCGPPTGGDCGSMLIGIGSDFSCQVPPLNGYLRTASRSCFSTTSSGVYSPGLEFTGAPIPPICQASAATVGMLSPSGPQTLCCL